MFEFKLEKLFVSFKSGIKKTEPIVSRCYTMTHSDETQDLFVTIGVVYDWDKITSMRDEVLAEWVKEDGKYKMNVYLHVDGENGLKETKIRDGIFRNELPLALTSIRYADRKLFSKNNYLDNAPIIVHFNSKLDEYNKIENWGIFKEYAFVEEENKKVCLGDNERKEFGNRDVENECKLQESMILNLLNPYIEKQIWITYSRPEYFCLDKVEILQIKAVRLNNPCRKDYEVAVGIRVGKNPPPYNNMIIEFLVAPNGVTVKSVKNPR